jgi:hypothetical protein
MTIKDNLTPRERQVRETLAGIRPDPPREHRADCPERRARASVVALECDHGYDVCPICDPCTCP